MTHDVQAVSTPSYKDRKGGLIAFGIIQVIFGIFCLLMVPFMVFSMTVASPHSAGASAPVEARMMIMVVLVYLVLAVWSIWMGIGSMLARRWARALLLVTSWCWLICGIMGMGVALACMPAMYEQMGQNGIMPRQMVTVMKYAMIGFMVLFYVIIPGLFILFYGSRNVKVTCERRDPQLRWTDHCPLPVLAMSLLAWLWCVCTPIMGVYGWVVPFFGILVSGAAGAVLLLAVMVMFGYVAWGLYKMDIKAWWGAVAMIAIWGVSCAITFSRISLMDYYAKMNISGEQLAMMKPFTESFGSLTIPFVGVWVAVALAYLFYIKRYWSCPKCGTLAGDTPPIPEVVSLPSPPEIPVAPPVEGASGGLAIASLVMGVLAVVLGIFVIGGLFGLIGLILGIIHLVRGRSRRVMAGWGIGLSVIGCLLTTAMVIVVFVSLKAYQASMPQTTPEQRYLEAVKELADPATPEINRFYTLNLAAKESFNRGEKEKARAYAEEQSRLLDCYKDDWNYGNAVQDINLVLGRIAVSEGNLEKAKEHLLKAGDSPGSPQMNSFGPNMSLAKDLLEKGEKQVVLEYFKKCSKFWKMDYGKLTSWAKQVETGKIPEFGANLMY